MCIAYGYTWKIDELLIIVPSFRFAQAKKCSNEGRALMQLDFQQFRIQIERMSNIRYTIKKECVCDIVLVMDG